MTCVLCVFLCSQIALTCTAISNYKILIHQICKLTHNSFHTKCKFSHFVKRKKMKNFETTTTTLSSVWQNGRTEKSSKKSIRCERKWSDGALTYTSILVSSTFGCIFIIQVHVNWKSFKCQIINRHSDFNATTPVAYTNGVQFRYTRHLSLSITFTKMTFFSAGRVSVYESCYF